MQESQSFFPQDEDSAKKKLTTTDPSEDGRNKEWQDRSRVNLDVVPEGTSTNVERDFEPESPAEEKKDEPAY